MITEDSLQEFKCALSVRRHYLIDPITLTNCGHSVCKKCLLNLNENFIECKTCGIETELDLCKIQVSKATQQALKFCFGNIFEILERDMSVKLNELKYHLTNEDEFIEIKLKYILEEINNRVESIKNDAEEAGFRLKGKLKKTVKEHKKINTENEVNDYNSCLEELQSMIKSKTCFNEHYLNKIQSKLDCLDEFFLRQIEGFPEITISNSKLTENMIGEIFIVNGPGFVKSLFQNAESFDLEMRPIDIAVLPNDQIISANYIDYSIAVYDQNFNLLKKIDKINGKYFSPIAVQVNSNDKLIYICDYAKHRILMTDVDFNLIKSVGSNGAKIDEFNNPFDICYNNESLYICDHYNERIQIYSKDLEFIKSIQLEYKPWKVKASNSIICVEKNTGHGVYFYSLTNCELIKSYESQITGRISQFNLFFYVFNHQANEFFCYDENGILKEELTLTGVDGIFTNVWDGAFIENNGKLLIQSYTTKKIIKFSKD